MSNLWHIRYSDSITEWYVGMHDAIARKDLGHATWMRGDMEYPYRDFNPNRGFYNRTRLMTRPLPS